MSENLRKLSLLRAKRISEMSKFENFCNVAERPVANQPGFPQKRPDAYGDARDVPMNDSKDMREGDGNMSESAHSE